MGEGSASLLPTFHLLNLTHPRPQGDRSLLTRSPSHLSPLTSHLPPSTPPLLAPTFVIHPAAARLLLPAVALCLSARPCPASLSSLSFARAARSLDVPRRTRARSAPAAQSSASPTHACPRLSTLTLAPPSTPSQPRLLVASPPRRLALHPRAIAPCRLHSIAHVIPSV
jgi:hypothetical protein